MPELVAQKNLCPHQDYVYMSAPLQAEQQEIREFRQEAEAFVQRLCADQEFAAALESHACVSRPRECVEEILDDPPFYSSVAFFLNHVRGHPPRELLRTLGLSPRKCPKLDMDWLTILLAGCFYTHAKSFAAHKDLFRRLLRDAKRVGVVDRRTVSLKSSTNVARLLIRSASKLRSIEDIVRLESDSPGAEPEDGDSHGPYPPGGFPQGRGRRETDQASRRRADLRADPARPERQSSPPGGSLEASLGMAA